MYKNTHEAQIYKSMLRRVGDLKRDYEMALSNSSYEAYIHAEMECADYAYDNEEEIWDD